MGGFWLPNGGPKIGTHASVFALEIGLHLEGRFCRSRTPQEVPKSIPRPPQDAIWGSFLAVLAVKLGQVRSKKPKTIVHINVADIAEIDKDKTLQPPGAIKKGRAGGGVPPWGRQSAATRRVGACPDSFRNLLRILRTQKSLARARAFRKSVLGTPNGPPKSVQNRSKKLMSF